MFRALAMEAVLRLVTVFAALEADNVQPFVDAFDDDRGGSVFQFENHGDWERLVKIHFHTDAGELPPGCEYG